MNPTPITKPKVDKELIEHLKSLVEMAETGKLTSMSAVYDCDTGIEYFASAACDMAIVQALDVCKMDLFVDLKMQEMIIYQ